MQWLEITLNANASLAANYIWQSNSFRKVTGFLNQLLLLIQKYVYFRGTSEAFEAKKIPSFVLTLQKNGRLEFDCLLQPDKLHEVRRSIWRKIHGVKYYLIGLFYISFSYSDSVLILAVENHLSSTVFSRKCAVIPHFSLGFISYCTSTLTVSGFQRKKNHDIAAPKTPGER